MFNPVETRWREAYGLTKKTAFHQRAGVFAYAEDEGYVPEGFRIGGIIYVCI
jgi:hypothetical protein